MAPSKKGFVPLTELAGVTPRPHSKLGMASFFLSISPFLFSFVSTVPLFFFLGSEPDIAPSDSDAWVAFAITVAVAWMLAILLGLVFGVISVFQKKKQRDFGVAGLIISLLWVLLTVMGSILE